MLKLVLGGNLSGKTEYIRNLVADGVRSGESGYVIIVPEQFSFETEKAMLEKVGAQGMQRLDVLSFSRLAEVILDECGKKSLKPPADNGVRMLCMSAALDSLEGRLDVFKKYSSRPALTGGLISFASEIKQCGVSAEEIKAFADNLKPSSLKSKLSELSVIISLYNALITRSYYDGDDALTVLCSALEEYAFFKNRTVVLDAFTSFTKQEKLVLEKITAQSKNVYVTLCTDGKKNDDFSVFANVNKQADFLKDCAARAGVEISKPAVLYADEKKRKDSLAFLEKNIFKADGDVFDGCPDEITVCSAPSETDECEFVAMTVKKLLREKKARCRDIIIYQRTKDDYDKKLASAFRKFGVPYYEDKRQPIKNQPLIIFVDTLLEIAVNGISADSLMRHLKTGLSDISDDEISEMENYALMWKISASEWKNDFTENPRGFGFETNDFDRAEIERLNAVRKKAVAPVLAFKRDFSAAQGREKTRVLYSFLEKSNIRSRLSDFAKTLLSDGNTVLFEEQDTVWTLFCDILDKLYLAADYENISDKRYYELFNSLLLVSDIGSVPQGLDGVTVACADRTRSEGKRYVFIVGANEGVFPLKPSEQGLLNDNERIFLKENGIELAQTAEYKLIEEKFFVYHTLTTATDGLFVTYSAVSDSGEGLMPSETVEELCRIFPGIRKTSYENIPFADRVESKQSVFEMLAVSRETDDGFSRAAREYLIGDGELADKVAALEKAVEKAPASIKDEKISTELFGRHMYLSASRVEAFYKCPFGYFCRYGLKAEARRQARVDAALSGSVIHYIFEKMLSEFSKTDLEKMNDNELQGEIDRILKNYLNENMGGGANKTKRFLKQYSAIGSQGFTILKRMIEEFKESEFTPVDFELSIGSDGEIAPYEIKMKNGSSLKISGSVDRVDVMLKNGKKYLRVVDYKSGGKAFNLYDVVQGLSDQMLIYLFAIEKNGEKKYGDIVPSGVLYMSAKPERADLGRNASQAEIDKKRLKSNRMNGIVLNDIDVIEGMEKDIGGVYIPVTVSADGTLKGSLITDKELKALHGRVDELLTEMVHKLQTGYIPVLPTGEDACKWCDFRPVCGYEQGDALREIPKIKDRELLDELSGEAESDV